MIETRGSGGVACAETAARQRLWAACAGATEAELQAAVVELGDVPEAAELRAPQSGLLMLRGRIGGNGQPFNVGEVTVTRAAVCLPSGAVGFSCLLGRSRRRARLAALLDALAQEPALREKLELHFVAPVMARRADERAAVDAEVAATRVDFFTLVRGED